ncbi:putative glutaredoxin [Lyophyllum shimeji]|uniref:glutathione peroxidase n=1 Tax=Lyophyllum shimeji TaxID=47721 RepID=A0A9P3UTL8_LYOSH|nr:putative glutaredoxin [Lyophyllum shimeji]
MSVKELVDNAIEKRKIAIFSKSWCPYCKKAKALIAEKFPDVDKEVFELDEREDGAAIQKYLEEKTGQRTVPNVFVAGQHIGGNDDTQSAYAAGKLDQLLRV